MNRFTKEHVHTSGVNYVQAMKWAGDGDHAAFKVTINGTLYSGADTTYEANVIAYAACIMLRVFGYDTRVSFLI